MKQLIRFIVKTELEPHWKHSYSQHAEDLAFISALEQCGQWINNGRYLDIGAHHPRRFSNTQLLYELGWSGVNVEPNPDLIGDFLKSRKRDVNVNSAVGSAHSYKLYVANKSAMSTTLFKVAQNLELSNVKILREVDVKGVSLRSLLDTYFQNRGPDLLNIDAEGSDLEILISGQLHTLQKKHLPSWIMIELLPPTRVALSSTIVGFLEQLGYESFLVLPRSVLMRNTNFRNSHDH